MADGQNSKQTHYVFEKVPTDSNLYIPDYSVEVYFWYCIVAHVLYLFFSCEIKHFTGSGVTNVSVPGSTRCGF